MALITVPVAWAGTGWLTQAVTAIAAAAAARTRTGFDGVCMRGAPFAEIGFVSAKPTPAGELATTG
ncbi:hypothetical protein GCM10023334_011080 [Nonomuraea thailandensis]